MMNIIQTQERLRDLPNEALMTYAAGANPEVPAFLALNELNRRKRMMEAASAPQMPQGTIAEEVMAGASGVPQQSMGLGALPPAMGMPPGMPPQGPMPMPGQMPGGGMPQPGMVPAAMGPRPGPAMMGGMPAQPQPQNPAAQPNMRMMAAGGLVSLDPPIPESMYSGGGLVAFAEGGYYDEDPFADPEPEPEPEADAGADHIGDEAAVDAVPVSTMASTMPRGAAPSASPDKTVPIQYGGPLQERAAAMRKALDAKKDDLKPPEFRDPMQMREEYFQKHGEKYGLASLDPSKATEDATRRKLELEAQHDPVMRKQLDEQKLANLFYALSQVRGTGRGAAGIASALGSFGREMAPLMQEQMQAEAAFQKRPMNREQALQDLKVKLDALRQAQFKGDFEDAKRAQLAYEKAMYDHSKFLRKEELEELRHLEQLALKEYGQNRQLEITREQARNRNTRGAGGAGRGRGLTENAATKLFTDAETRVQETVNNRRTKPTDPIMVRYRELSALGMTHEQAVQRIAMEIVQRQREGARAVGSGMLPPLPTGPGAAPAPAKPGAPAGNMGPGIKPPSAGMVSIADTPAA